MPMFIPPMLISLRSRKPLIMVVLCMSCPAIFVLIVILKSPLIGWSVSGLCWANEIALTAETAQLITPPNNHPPPPKTPPPPPRSLPPPPPPPPPTPPPSPRHPPTPPTPHHHPPSP